MSIQDDTSSKSPLVRSIITVLMVVCQCGAVVLCLAVVVCAFMLVQHYLAGRPFNDTSMLRLGQNVGTFAAGWGGVLGPLLVMTILSDEEKSRAQRVIAGLVAGFILGFSLLRWFSDSGTAVLLGAAVGSLACACVMLFKSKPAQG
jgi:hypothetical protein